MKRIAFILLSSAFFMLAADPQKAGEVPAVSAQARGDWYKAISKYNKAVADITQAQVTFDRNQKELPQLQAAVDAAAAKLCPDGYVSTPGKEDEPVCSAKPKEPAIPPVKAAK